jgi:hypothetical protein
MKQVINEAYFQGIIYLSPQKERMRDGKDLMEKRKPPTLMSDRN